MSALVMYRGNTRRFQIAVKLNGAPRPLGGCTLWFTAKFKLTDHDSQAVLQLSTGHGVDAPNPLTGVAIALIQPAHTSHLPNAEVLLVYDWQILTEDGDLVTIETGTLSVKPTVTETQSTPLPVPVVDLSILTQAAIYVDPANVSGHASNLNQGDDPVYPLLDEGEITTRRRRAAMVSNYGGHFPILQDTTVTYLSEPVDPLAHPIINEVIRIGSANLAYVTTPPTVRTDSIASIVTPRGGASGWRITSTAGFTSADVGLELVDTTSGCTATVLAVSGGVADTSEWLLHRAGPVKTFGTAFTTQPVAPHAGDLLTVRRRRKVKLGRAAYHHFPGGGTFEVWAGAFYGFEFVADLVHGFGFPDAAVVTGETFSFGLNLSGAAFTQCSFQGQMHHVQAFDAMVNCYAPVQGSATDASVLIVGGLVNAFIVNGAWLVLDGYVAINGPFGGAIADQQRPQKSVIFLGTALLYQVHDAFLCDSGVQIRILSGLGLNEEVVGTHTGLLFEVSNGGLVLKITGRSWSQVFGGVVGPNFANLDKDVTAVAFNRTTCQFGASAIAVTPANLDAATPGGLGGNAVVPGTGTGFRPF